MYLVWISKYCMELYDQQRSYVDLKLLYKLKWFIKSFNFHQEPQQTSYTKSKKLFARSLRSRLSGVISAFININIDLEYRKLGHLISKHTKFNVCKNDCTCARNILSFFLLYVNEITKNGCFVVKWYAVREAKQWRYAVCKAEIGRHAVRKGCHPHGNRLWYMYYLYQV